MKVEKTEKKLTTCRGKKMPDFIELLILSYFKQFREYSYQEIAELLGMPMVLVDEYINEMFSNGLLEYRDYMLTLSFKGRIKLQESVMEDYSFDVSNSKIDSFIEKAWKLDKIYIPKRFLEKVRR